jgi:hypothetical protein
LFVVRLLFAVEAAVEGERLLAVALDLVVVAA